MSFGDYTNFQRLYTSKNLNRAILVSEGTSALAGLLTPKSANHQLYIQKITLFITTAAAQGIVFQDTASTPLKIAAVPASATLPQVFDFGPTGVPLTAGKNLDAICTAGVVGYLHIEAYERQVSGALNTSIVASGQ